MQYWFAFRFPAANYLFAFNDSLLTREFFPEYEYSMTIWFRTKTPMLDIGCRKKDAALHVCVRSMACRLQIHIAVKNIQTDLKCKSNKRKVADAVCVCFSFCGVSMVWKSKISTSFTRKHQMWLQMRSGHSSHQKLSHKNYVCGWCWNWRDISAASIYVCACLCNYSWSQWLLEWVIWWCK